MDSDCVDGGIATVLEATVPACYEVEITDFDNLREAPQVTLKELSKEARRVAEAYMDLPY